MAKTTPQAVALLLKLDFYRLGCWNEFAHTRDTRARRRWLGLALAWVMTAGIVLFYLIMLSIGMAAYGLSAFLPGCLFTGASAALLFFETLRAGSFLFSYQFVEQTSPLPLPSAALPLSRLAELYLCDLALCTLLLGPGLILYPMANSATGPLYWAAALWGLLLAPLLPLAGACFLGALTAAPVRRMRHKNLIAGLLLVGFTMAILAWSMSLTAMPADTDGADLMAMLEPALRKASAGYAPAAWFGQMLAGGSGSFPALLCLTLISLFSAGLAAAVVTKKYGALCAALNAPAGRYRAARKTGVHSPLTALYLREVKRYLACTNWFANTVVGYLLMAALPLVLLFSGDHVMQSLGLTTGMVARFLPLALGMCAVLMPVTACSVSLEGAQWPLIRTLPVSSRDLLLAKVLLNLTVALPCWAAAVIGGLLAVQPWGLEILWFVLVPAVYCVYGAVAALRINLALPQLHWQTETQAVKQSASTLAAMLTGMAAAVLPGLCLALLPEDGVYAVTCTALAVLTAWLWRQSLRVNLQKIQ